jgi:hypothetical protein
MLHVFGVMIGWFHAVRTCHSVEARLAAGKRQE